MDPDATLRMLLEAIQDGRDIDAAEAAHDLSHWLRNGGFPPSHDVVLVHVQHQLDAPLALPGRTCPNCNDDILRDTADRSEDPPESPLYVCPSCDFSTEEEA